MVRRLALFAGWGLLPHSGHMLFLTFALATTPGWAFRTWALVLFGMTTGYKLGIRHDWYSGSWGLGLGLAAAVIWWLAGDRADENANGET